MIKIHVISDLFLGFNEPSPEDEVLPDVDLVVINGNIGLVKRSMFYAERLCLKYPNIQFIVNLGQSELYSTVPKFVGELVDSLNIRKSANASWPKNLHWSTDPQVVTCNNGTKIDVLCVYGFPKINSLTVPWETTVWYKNHILEMTYDISETGTWKKPFETSHVEHGAAPKFPSVQDINKEHEKERRFIRAWELNQNSEGSFKLLVTHLNPHNDPRCQGMVVSPYLIHLYKGIWISAYTKCNGVGMLGAKLYSNPGRGSHARQNVIIV